MYVTVASVGEGRGIADAVVGERLAACVTLLEGAESVYWWDGEIQHDREVILLIKTARRLFAPLLERVRSLHSYRCPCVCATEIAEVNGEYGAWVEETVRKTP